MAHPAVAPSIVEMPTDPKDLFTGNEGSMALRAFLEPDIETKPASKLQVLARSLEKKEAVSARQYNLLKPTVVRSLMVATYNEKEFATEFAKTCEFQTDEAIADFIRTRMPSVSAHVVESMVAKIIEFGHCSALQAILAQLPPYYTMLNPTFLSTIQATIIFTGIPSAPPQELKLGTFTAVCQSKWADVAEFYFFLFGKCTPFVYRDVRDNFIAIVTELAKARRFVELLSVIEDVLMNPSFSDEFVSDEYTFVRRQRIKVLEGVKLCRDTSVAFQICDAEEAARQTIKDRVDAQKAAAAAAAAVRAAAGVGAAPAPSAVADVVANPALAAANAVAAARAAIDDACARGDVPLNGGDIGVAAAEAIALRGVNEYAAAKTAADSAAAGSTPPSKPETELLFQRLVGENMVFTSDEEQAAFRKLFEMERTADVVITKMQQEIETAQLKRDMYFKRYIYKPAP
jgi:hypothetical protein